VQNLISEILHKFHVSQLSEETVLALSKELKPVSIKKGAYFLRAGQVSTSVGLIKEGVFRVFYLSNDKEHTSYFNVETRNPFVAAFTSFLKQEPSKESIQALEDCTVLTLTYSALQKLYATYPEMERLGRLLAEQNYLLAMERIYDLQQQKADFKYNKFMELYPGLLNRIPHHYIASYLGVTPESLSRLRKAQMEN
jgi:CRP-like cAMP-binding protein